MAGGIYSYLPSHFFTPAGMGERGGEKKKNYKAGEPGGDDSQFSDGGHEGWGQGRWGPALGLRQALSVLLFLQ